jgi:hypothetical protein
MKKDGFESESKTMFLDKVETCMKTIMVGCLTAVENHFGEFWCHGERVDLTEEQIILKSIYDKLRKEMFDIGNQQIKNVKRESEDYKILRSKYSVNLPVIKEGLGNEKRS